MESQHKPPEEERLTPENTSEDVPGTDNIQGQEQAHIPSTGESGKTMRPPVDEENNVNSESPDDDDRSENEEDTIGIP